MVRKEEIELLDEMAEKHLILPHHDGRIVIVGDIHGCFDEFSELLSQIAFDVNNNDLLLCAGDLV